MIDNEILNYLNLLKKEDNVYLANIPASIIAFESFYLNVRKAEKRLLSDEEVNGLPILKNSPHSKEWEKRARSAQRVSRYFMDKQSGNLLDLGCGNGWFSAILSENRKLKVLAMDVNLTELKQAARIYNQPNLNFIYGDVFHTQLPDKTFNYITINAVIQYFEDLNLLIKRLFELLNPDGEIHFIDSPFYNDDEISGARERTVKYYTDKGFPAMSKYYFHHSWSEISKYEPVVMYKYKSKNKIFRFFEKSDMPFPWIKIIKPDVEGKK